MSVAEILQALEQELLTASVRKESARVAGLLAEDFREFGSSGRVFTRAETVEALRDEVPTTLCMQDFGFVSLAEDVFLVTYRTPSCRTVFRLQSHYAVLSGREPQLVGRWSFIKGRRHDYCSTANYLR